MSYCVLFPLTSNRLLLLQQAFALAKKKIGSGPNIKKLEVNNARLVYFEKWEIEGLIPHLPEDLQDFTRFAFLTGMRHSEIASLRWREYNKSAETLILRAEYSKNGEPRIIPLVGALATLIERRSQARTFEGPKGETCIAEKVFFRKGGRDTGDFKKAFKSACEAAGLKYGRKVEGGKTFHDTRRSAATNMSRAGVPREVAKKVTGHKTDIMYTRYRIVEDSDIREGLQRTEEYLKSLPDIGNIVSFRKAEVR